MADSNIIELTTGLARSDSEGSGQSDPLPGEAIDHPKTEEEEEDGGLGSIPGLKIEKIDMNVKEEDLVKDKTPTKLATKAADSAGPSKTPPGFQDAGAFKKPSQEKPRGEVWKQVWEEEAEFLQFLKERRRQQEGKSQDVIISADQDIHLQQQKMTKMDQEWSEFRRSLSRHQEKLVEDFPAPGSVLFQAMEDGLREERYRRKLSEEQDGRGSSLEDRRVAWNKFQKKKEEEAALKKRKSLANSDVMNLQNNEKKTPVMQQLLRMEKEISREMNNVEGASKSDLAYNKASKASDVLSDLGFAHDLTLDEEEKRGNIQAMIDKIVEARPVKSTGRHGGVRMPAVDLSLHSWEGNEAELTLFINKLDSLLGACDPLAKHQYLLQCLQPRHRHLIQHTTTWDQAIKVLKSLAIDSSAELEDLHAKMLSHPIAETEAEQLDALSLFVTLLHRALSLDPRWHLSLHAGSSLIRTLYNDVDISSAVDKLEEEFQKLQTAIDGEDSSGLKRNGTASVAQPLVVIFEGLRNKAVKRSAAIQQKARGVGNHQATALVHHQVVTSRKIDLSQSKTVGRPAKVQSTSVSVSYVCDLCQKTVHGHTRNCFGLRAFKGKAKDLPANLCPQHLGPKNVNCGAGGKCDEYLCPQTGETRSSVCFNSKPAVNFRICPCAECHERNGRAEERRQRRRTGKSEKKLWPPASPTKTGQVGARPPAKGAGGAGGSRQSVSVRAVDVKVDRTNVTVDSSLTFVNGSALGSTVCPTEILSIMGPGGEWTDILVLYDSCSQCTFFDPSLEMFCTKTRGSGNESIIIRTFSGQTESSTCRIGELRIPRQGEDPITVEGLLMGTKKKTSYRATLLPSRLHQMRDTGILAREPMNGVSYPTILFGADLVTEVFPNSVFEGAEGFVDQGFSLLKSRLSGRYIPTGALRAKRSGEGENKVGKNVAKVMRVLVEGKSSKRSYDKFCRKYDDVSEDEDEEIIPVPARQSSQDDKAGAVTPCEASPSRPSLLDLPNLPDLPDLQVIQCFTCGSFSKEEGCSCDKGPVSPMTEAEDLSFKQCLDSECYAECLTMKKIDTSRPQAVKNNDQKLTERPQPISVGASCSTILDATKRPQPISVCATETVCAAGAAEEEKENQFMKEYQFMMQKKRGYKKASNKKESKKGEAGVGHPEEETTLHYFECPQPRPAVFCDMCMGEEDGKSKTLCEKCVNNNALCVDSVCKSHFPGLHFAKGAA
jgi:hypothetical protein